MSDAIREMVHCGSNDPELLARLNRFADHRFETAESIRKVNQPSEVDRGQAEAIQFEMAYLASAMTTDFHPTPIHRNPRSRRTVRTSGASQPPAVIRPELDASAYNLARSEQERRAL